MKRYLGIFILTIMVGLSGCASDTDSDTQVSSRAYSMQIQQNQNRVQTFNGRRQIRSSDGSMWTPPAGSYQDKDGYILDKDGTTLGQTGFMRIDNSNGPQFASINGYDGITAATLDAYIRRRNA